MRNLSHSLGKYTAIFSLSAAFMLTILPSHTGAAPTQDKYPKVPTDIYQWVQASPRTSYYFNRKYICFQTDDKDTVNVDVLLVPILRTYDHIQVADIVAKRRWHQQDWEELDELLAAEANHVIIDREKRTVTVRDSILLTENFDHLYNEPSNRVIELDSLNEQSLERRFYESILQYAIDESDTLVANTKGTITEADNKKLAAIKKAEEKRRKAAEKAKKNEIKHDY